MKTEYIDTDWSTYEPHVVFKNTAGQIVFAAKSCGYHIGLEVLGEFANFQKAAEFVLQEADKLPPTALPPETPSPDATPALLGEHPSDSTTA